MPIPQLLNIYANNIQHYVLKLCKNMKKILQIALKRKKMINQLIFDMHKNLFYTKWHLSV